jgi:iron(III) transport system substrate-binding protein
MPVSVPRRLAAASVLVIAALGLSACAGSTAPGASSSTDPSSLSGTSITVYNAQHEELTQAWADAFTKKTGIEVVLRNGSDSELGNQIVQEGSASPADVFLTENSPAMSLVENAGLLAPVDAATLANVPAQYRPASGDWTGIAARSTVMVYNPSLISSDQLPTSIMDCRSRSGRDGGRRRPPERTSRRSSPPSCRRRARTRRPRGSPP